MQKQPDEDRREIVTSRRSASVLDIQLNRPASGNRLTKTAAELLISTLAGAYGDQTRFVVISGRGADFCTGAEAADMHPGAGLALRLQMENILNLIARAPFFSIACLHGRVFDSGADLAAMCDWRLASAEAQLCFRTDRQPDEVYSARRLSDIVGGFRAFDLIMRGSVVPAEAAHGWGLVTDLVEMGALASHLEDLCGSLGRSGKESIAILREAIRTADGAADVERVVRSTAAGARG